VEFIRTVLAEVKTDKYESRILVCFSYLVYYLQQAATAVDYFISFCKSMNAYISTRSHLRQISSYVIVAYING